MSKSIATHDQQAINQLRDELSEANERAQKYRTEASKLKEEIKKVTEEKEHLRMTYF